MQVLYGILVQHFANLAGCVPLLMDAIDVLTVHILQLTAEVPYYAATVARARLTRAQKRMSAALSGSDGVQGAGWPGELACTLLCASKADHLHLLSMPSFNNHHACAWNM